MLTVSCSLGTVYQEGWSSNEVHMIVLAVAAPWRSVEGIIWDRTLKKQLK